MSDKRAVSFDWLAWGLGAAAVVIAALILYPYLRDVFQKNSLPPGQRPSPTAVKLTATALPSPTPCVPNLRVGSQTFPIHRLSANPDGTLPLPADQNQVAFTASDPNSPVLAFAFSPTTENLARISAWQPGTQVLVTWLSCSTAVYQLTSVTAGAIPPTGAELTITVGDPSGGAGLTALGQLVGEEILAPPTPPAGEVQAEISLLDTTISTDGSALLVSLSILNTGAEPVVLNSADVSLTAADGAPQPPSQSAPPLPLNLQPGAAETVGFTFARPAAPEAVLKIWTVEFSLEGY